MSRTLSKLVTKAPHGPGIYRFLDAEGAVLYVGKAKDLKKRLQSYVRPSMKHGVKTERLLESAVSVEWTETNSEIEALLLEDNLIKELSPKYNVLLKDSKTFQYIKVSVQDDYPEVTTVRRIERDGAKYFGPKTSGSDVIHLMESVKRIFKLCSVRSITLNPRGTPLKGAKVAVKVGGTEAKRPCLDYHIKRCSGPCAGMVTPEEYHEQIRQVLQFLKGDYKPAIKALESQMREFAADRKFERAAALRDQIEAIKRSDRKQIITDTNLTDRDVVAYVEDLGKNYFVLFQIRGGKLINQERFISEGGDSPMEIMETFLMEYYSRAADIPKEVIISIQLKERGVLEKFIGTQAGKRVKIHTPQAGHKDQLIALAEKNARSYAEQSRARWMADEKNGKKALEELQSALKLSEPPKRIECYDISHLGGTETIGSMIVFKNGEPCKSDYRMFRLRSTANKNDDFMSMEEIMSRRLNYLPAHLPEGFTLRKMKKSESDLIEERWPDLDDADPKQFYVASHKDQVVAMGRLCHLSEKIDELSALWVAREKRGKKLGYFILRKLIEQSKQKRLYLFCNPSLEEYYLKMGFERIREAPKELKDKVKAINSRLEKPLEVIYMAYQKKKQDVSYSARPDLIVIDGGKGQLHAAHDVLFKKGLSIPMISLAKKDEHVFIPGKSDPVDLPKNASASYLLQRMRDEAHRFAIEANRKSRDKKMITSGLDAVPGVGPKLKKKLLNYFGSVQRVKEAPQAVLEEVAGEGVAKRIKEQL
jgi:excinuclease ABC subunit C